jgi:hypothetical protein
MRGLASARSVSMHAAKSLIEEAVASGVSIWVEGRSLRYRASSGSLTEHLRRRVDEHKATLIDLLKGPSVVSRGPQQELPFLVFYHGLWEKIRSGRLGVGFTNLHAGTEINGAEIELSFVEHRIRHIVARHPILSARVSDTSGMPRFIVDGRAAPVEFVDCSAVPAATVVERAREALEEIRLRPFRAEEDALFRPFVIRLARSRHYVGFILNHLIGDRNSVAIILNELLTGRATPKPPQYSDYVLATNEWLASPALTMRMLYWKTHLRGATPCRLPPDRILDPQEWCDISDFKFFLGVSRTRGIYSLARRLAVTPPLVLQAVHARALGLRAHQHTVTLLSMYHGRDDARTWDMVGSFQNQLALCTRSDGHEPFDSLVEKCQQVYMAALRNVVPYHYVRGILPALGIHECFPEFNCAISGELSAEGPAEPPARDPGAKDWHAARTPPTSVARSRVADFPDHKFSLWSEGNNVGVSVTYLPAEHDESSIRAFAACVCDVIDAVTRMPAG